MLRICYLGLGHLCVVLAIIGAILPGMPTVVFLIVAAWAYGKSSEKFQRMLHEHPKFGSMIINWERYGVIPAKAKILAGIAMAASTAWCFHKSQNWVWPALLAITLVLVYAYILSRPSQVADLSTMSGLPESDQG